MYMSFIASQRISCSPQYAQLLLLLKFQQKKPHSKHSIKTNSRLLQHKHSQRICKHWLSLHIFQRQRHNIVCSCHSYHWNKQMGTVGMWMGTGSYVDGYRQLCSYGDGYWQLCRWVLAAIQLCTWVYRQVPVISEVPASQQFNTSGFMQPESFSRASIVTAGDLDR